MRLRFVAAVISGLALGIHGHASAVGTNVTKLTTPTGSTSQTTGSVYIICTVYGSGTAPIASNPVTDNKGNTYSQIATGGPWAYPGGGGDTTSMRIYACVNGAGGANHTFSVDYTITAGACWASIVGFEIKGALTVSAIDTGSGPNYQQNVSGPPFSITSNTLAQPDEFVFCLCGMLGSGSSTIAASGWTYVDGEPNNATWSSAVLYRIVSSTTAVTAAVTDSTGSPTGMQQMIMGVKG